MRNETVKDIIGLFESADIMMAYHDILCGDWIGCGCSRAVYECNYDKSCVVKIHANIDRMPSDNILEWELWETVKWMNSEVRNWFAPCVGISENGRILIQKKTVPLTDKKWKALVEVPAFLTDIKRANFGTYKGHICMHDYASCIFRLEFNKRKRKISKEDRNRM